MVKSKLNKDFNKIFLKKEGLSLVGANFVNIWVLVLILFFTFLSIGLANGSLKYLESKMSDPFVNWVNIDVPYSKQNEITRIKRALNSDDVKSEFKVLNVTGYYRFFLPFKVNGKDNEVFQSFGRTIEIDNPLFSRILSEENLLTGKGFKSNKDIGLILTYEFLEKLKYNLSSSHMVMEYKISDSDDADYVGIPIPIVAIVHDLPGKSDFLATKYFWKMKKHNINDNSAFDPKREENLTFFLAGDSLTAENVYEDLNKFVIEVFNLNNPLLIKEKYNKSHVEGYKFSVLFYPKIDDLKEILAAVNKIKKSTIWQKYNLLHLFDYESRLFADDTFDRYDNLSVNFTSLDDIRVFSGYLAKDYGIEIDMAQIEAKENYNFISKLTRILSVILIGFSILSICLFVAQILKKHLEKISKNIGTFKAFGVSNSSLQSVYLYLISIYILGSLTLSYLLAWAVGELGAVRVIFELFEVGLETGEDYFLLFHPWTLISVIALLIISLLVLRYTTSDLLSRTPGDLVYEREKQK